MAHVSRVMQQYNKAGKLMDGTIDSENFKFFMSCEYSSSGLGSDCQTTQQFENTLVFI